MGCCADKKDKCCGISKVVIPAALGGHDGEYAPQNGAYQNTLVYYEASGVSYLYANDGSFEKLADGIAATIEIGETTTLTPGSDATVENVGTKYHAKLNFGIPQGEKGDAATISVGSTTTGAAGTDASVTNSGDEHNAVFDFVIPRGDKGDQGDAATINVGTVTTTTLEPGEQASATVTNSGTTENAVLDFGFDIPKGEKGDTGATGSIKSELVDPLPATGQEDTYYLTNDSATKGTATGNPIQLNLANQGKIEELKLNGNATQQTYSGKNLFSVSFDSGGSTPASDTNAFTLTKPSVRTKLFVFPTPLAAGTYTISFNITSDTTSQSPSSGGVRYQLVDENDSVISGTATVSIGTGAKNKTWTTTVPIKSIYFYIASAEADNVSVAMTNVMLEKSATATAYEPYTNGPAPNPDYPQDVNVVTGAQTVSVVGKNLFNVNVTPSSYTNTTTSVSGNTITVTSTSNAQTARVDLPFVFEANKQMTISFDAKFTQNDAGDSLISQVCLRTPGTSDTIGNIVLTKTIGQTNHYSYVVSAAQSNNNTRQLWLYVKANALAGAVKVEFSNIQIEYGSATDYEPYQGQTLPVNLGGSNLFSFDNATLSQFPLSGLDFERESNSIIITSETTTGAQTQYATFIGRFDANKTYTLSGKGKKIVKGTDGQSWLYILWRGSNDNGSTWSSYNNIFQQQNPVQGAEYSFSGHFTGYTTYQFLFYNNSSTPVTVGEKTTYYDIMLNEGSTAIPFVPYTTYAYKLAKIGTYQDYIWNDGGTWKVHKEIGKVVLTGSADETWGSFSGSFAHYVVASDAKQLTGVHEHGEIVSNYFTATDYYELYYGNADYGISLTYNQSRITFRNKDCADLAAFKTWLSTHNTTVYYALATPTDTAITEQSLIDQLNAVANAQLYSGQNNIMNIAFSPNLAGDLEIGYASWVPGDRYDVYIWNDSTGWQIIHTADS